MKEFDPNPLLVAARAYAKAMVTWSKAYDAHANHRELDEFHSRRMKSESRLYHAEKARDQRKEELLEAALMFAGGDAADVAKELFG